MSFLTQSAIRRVTMLRAVPRAMATSAPRAAFSTSVTMHKSVTESAKETVTNAAQKLNHAVGDTVVGGIDMGSAAVNKVKDAMPDMGKASELSGEAKGKASELSGEAKGKASQVAGEAKGKAHEVTGKAKSAADDLK